jgi:hypothetical protein
MQVNSAQDYLTQVKRQIVAKTIVNSPQPAHRRYNYMYISQIANGASQYEKVAYPQTLSLAPGSIPGGRPIFSWCCDPYADTKLAAAAAYAASPAFAALPLVGTVSTFLGNGGFGVYTPTGTGTSNRFAVNDTVPLFVLRSDGTTLFAAIGSIIVAVTISTASWTLLAGGPSGGSADGTGGAATFNVLSSAALSSDQNTLFTLSRDGLRSVNVSSGLVTTIAMSGATLNYSAGSGPRATIRTPDGNLLVAFPSFNILVGITTTGTATVLAGVSGSSGILNGTGTAARFTSPRSLAINQAGTLIAIGDEHAVRLMTWPGLVVTTLAGVPGTSGYIDAAGAAARFSTVNSLAFLPSGNLLVSDSGNRRIRIINTQSTRVMTFAGSGVSGATNGSGLNATFNTPSVIALSSAGDAAYLIDSGNHIVRRIT